MKNQPAQTDRLIFCSINKESFDNGKAPLRGFLI